MFTKFTRAVKNTIVLSLTAALSISLSMIEGTKVYGSASLPADPEVFNLESDQSNQSAASGSSVSGQSITIEEPQTALSSAKSAPTIKKLKRTRYTVKKINLHKTYSMKSKVVKKIPANATIKITGKVSGKDVYRVSYKGKKGFIKKKKGTLTKKKPFIWKGPKLTKSKGVNAGPSGKETYYNLPMGGVIRILKSHNIKGHYWVRKDGCKMWGKYIMVAADQRIKSRRLGCIVPTSLGLGIVSDTGGFIYSNSRQLDIAVAW